MARTKSSRPCSVADCERVVKSAGLCDPHYKRVWRDPNADMSRPIGPRRSAPLPVIDLPDGSRVCQDCAEEKPLEAFHRDCKSPLGRRKTCRECRVRAETARYWSDAESHRARMRDFRSENPEHVRRRDALRYEQNRAAYIERSVEQVHRRRASMYAGPRDRGISRSGLRSLDGDECCYCGVTMVFASFPRGARPSEQATIEHVVPISRGGFHTWDNCTLACWRCNISKGARNGDWKLRRGHRLAS